MKSTLAHIFGEMATNKGGKRKQLDESDPGWVKGLWLKLSVEQRAAIEAAPDAEKTLGIIEGALKEIEELAEL
jgi:hypothetical protein